MGVLSALYYGGNALYWNGFMVVDGVSLGSFRFLADHWLASGEYIQKTTIRTMYSNEWSVTADVEPLDETATQSFWEAGPKLGACIRTQWQPLFMPRPETFWYEIAPNLWAISGLGVELDPVAADISRVEDK